MDRTDACQLVEAIRDSVDSEPSQFQIAVNVTGQKIVSHGGTGVQITATGGGPGSTTIGQKVSVEGAQIEIARQKGTAAMQQQMHALVNALDELAQELKSEEPDKTIIARIYESLEHSWVPGVITSVVGCAVAKWIGL